MKIDLSPLVLDLDGKPLNETLTMARACAQALTAATRDPLTPEKSLQRFEIAAALVQSAEIDLQAEQVVVVKGALAATFAALVSGQIIRQLEGQPPLIAAAA